MTHLIDNYIEWLKGGFKVEEHEDFFIIHTPYIDLHGDHIKIYVRPQGDGEAVLSDDGYCLAELILDGNKFEIPVAYYRDALGIEFDSGVFIVRTTAVGFPEKFHNLLQVMIILLNK